MSLFSIYTIPPFISAVAFIAIGVLVFLKNKKDHVNVLFFLMCISTFVWQLSWFFLFNTEDDFVANILIKVGYAGIIFIPVLFFNFFVIFVKKIKGSIDKFDKNLLLISYLFVLLFEAFLFYSDYFIQGYYKYFWGFYPKANWMHLMFLALVLILAARMIFLLYSEMKRQKKISSYFYYQLRFLLVAQLFYNLAVIDFIVNYGFEFYPFGFFVILIFLIIVAYSIITYRLMDIKLVLRQSTVYLISLVLTLIPPVVLKYLGMHYLSVYYVWLDVILLVISISLFPLVRDRVYRFSNKYLFTSLYDSKKVIADLSDRLSTTLVAKNIFGFIYKTLRNAFHMKAMAVLIFDKKGESLLVSYNKGFEGYGKKIVVGKFKEVYESLLKQDKIIVFEELKTHKSSAIKRFVREYNDKMGVEVLVPLNVKNKAVGLIAFGAKESGDIYNQEDIEVLKVISSQMAISLENATLYEEAKKFNVKLGKEVDRATKDLQNANEELRKLDEAKSEFISIASHQLRTPLTVVKGYVSMMLEGSFGKLTDTVDENLYKVYESNERLIHLVENLLNISRIESGRLQFNFEKADLVDTVESVVEELSHTAEKKKIYITFAIPKETIVLSMDEEKIRQVVINLIDNAVKYTKKGGVTVTLKKKGANALFCVSDSGMGISDSDMPNLFKKFSRGKDTSLVHTEGTGLGLFVGKMMITSHKGKIWAESKGNGKGSKFCFEIPLKIKNPPKTLDGDVM